MENMDNNMDDFFKKQFNRFDKRTEDWEKPNAGDWEVIASQVPMFNKTSFWNFSNVSLMVLSMVLVSSLVYVWVLRKEITVLEKTVKVQQEQIERVTQSVQIVGQRYIQEQQTIDDIKAENAQLRQQNQAIISQNEVLNTITKQQNKVISDFSIAFDNLKKSDLTKSIFNKKEVKNISGQSKSKILIANIRNENQSNESITDNIHNQSLAKAKNKINDNLENIKNRIAENATHLVVKEEAIELKELELLPSSRFSVISRNPVFFQPNPLMLNNDDSKKGKRPIIKLPNIDLSESKLGYEFRIQAMELPFELNITELETTLNEEPVRENLLRLHSFTLAVPLNENWSIQTGVRFSNSDLRFRQEVSSVYNTDNEVTFPDGTIAKSLNIVQKTPFSETTNAIQMLFDENDRLADGETFKWFSSGEQNQQTVQIPLGVNYEFGKNKLQYFLGTGVQWNNMQLKNNSYKMELEGSEKEFRMLNSDIEVQSSIEALNYFSAYGIIGLQYQFLNHWSMRTSATFNYHFLNTIAIENWNNSDKSIAIGVQYQF